jgi:hypothetical protein
LVSRALEACEGAVLLVDAAQGIEAQTLANLYLALDRDLAQTPIGTPLRSRTSSAVNPTTCCGCPALPTSSSPPKQDSPGRALWQADPEAS